MNTPHMVYILDDDAGVRKSLGWMLESNGLHFTAYDSAFTFLQEAQANCPSCLILDLQMPGMSGIDVLRHLKTRQDLHMPTIILSGSGSIGAAVESLKLGAHDFLEKPVNHEPLLTWARDALAKDAIYRGQQAREAVLKGRLNQLTDREREVLGLLCEGKSTKEMASKLNISIKTVSIHRWHLMKKMQVSSATEAVRLAHDAKAA
jgi:FixJ family two-component response regulator